MNLVSTPDGRIINLDHLTYAERTGEYLVLHFAGGTDSGSGSVIRLKQGEGARRVWAYLADKCTMKIGSAHLKPTSSLRGFRAKASATPISTPNKPRRCVSSVCQ